jgi:hypothetical protein
MGIRKWIPDWLAFKLGILKLEISENGYFIL